QRDVTLLVDKVDREATVDDGMVTVLPGETFTFRVRSKKPDAAELFCDPRVLRSTNQLVDRTSSRAIQPGALTHV
nr:hypothetical protein [Actinomycetota bacterium]